MLQQHWHFRGVDRDAFSPELSQIPLKFSAFSWNSKTRKVWVFFLNTMSSYTVYLSLSFLWIQSGTLSCPNQAKRAQLQAELRFSGESWERELILWLSNFNIIFMFGVTSDQHREFLSNACRAVSHTKHELESTFLSVGLSEKDNCLLNHYSKTCFLTAVQGNRALLLKLLSVGLVGDFPGEQFFHLKMLILLSTWVDFWQAEQQSSGIVLVREVSDSCLVVQQC